MVKGKRKPFNEIKDMVKSHKKVLTVGCGGCVGRCPVTALDMPYFSNQVLEALVADVLAGGKTYNEAS